MNNFTQLYIDGLKNIYSFDYNLELYPHVNTQTHS